MDPALHLDRALGRLGDGQGRIFAPKARAWRHGEQPVGGEAASLLEAVHWLQHDSGHPCRVPVGVVGPRQASSPQIETARRLGAWLGRLGLVVLCGGRQGVMEAVCRGVAQCGGVSVGLLPDAHWTAANPYVGIPLATGIGEARNALIARAALCLLAIGGNHGTMSEMAFAQQFGRPVFGLEDAPPVPGTVRVADADAALHAVARVVLALPEAAPAAPAEGRAGVAAR